jgi:4-amino-4-deoxy-L-arabinose transferase-like glycosyltransferase
LQTEERVPDVFGREHDDDHRARIYACIVLALAIAGVVLRVWVVASPLGHLDSDEAVVGLMADALRHGHISTYYWGQNYGGTLEPALVALAFTFTGSTTLGVKIVPIVVAAFAALLVWRVGRHTIGEPAARFAGALFWVFPPAFLWGSTKSRGFYQVALVLALGVMLCALRLAEQASEERHLHRRDVIALGFLTGLAVWTSPQTLYVLGPIGVWLAWRVRACWREVWPLIPAGLVGGLPWFVYVARHGRSAFFQTSVASSYSRRFRDFFTDMVPRAFGGKIPESSGFLGGVVGRVAFWTLLAIALLAVVHRLRSCESRSGIWLLVAIAVSYPFLMTVARVSTFTDEPRYALLLAPIVVLLLAWVLGSVGLHVAAAVFAIVLGVAFVGSTITWVDANPLQEDIGPPSLGELEHALDSRGYDRVYADYWIAYRLMFDTHERITASPVATMRNPEFATKVKTADVTPYVVYRGDVYDRAFGQALRRDHIGYDRFVTDRYSIYVPDRSVDPDRYDTIWQLDP